MTPQPTDAVDLDTTDCPHCVAGIAALDTYRAAVRAALVEEIVAKVEGRIKDLREPDLRDDDRVRYAFAGRMASYVVVLEIIRGLAAPTTEEG